MSMTDPIADMLTRIRNANSAFMGTVSMPSSKKLVEIARILKEEGYVAEYEVAPGEVQPVLTLTLKYGPKKERVITGIRRISKPGLRVYAGKTDIPRVLGGLGINILTTARGVMTGREAHKERVGGEVLCRVW